MAWWDAQHHTLGASPRSKSRLTMGDAFPRLEPTHTDKHIEMERERALLSPVFEEQLGSPTTPALVVHVDIRFTDPVIRSRYCRSYGSSPEFEVTNRTCRGLVRRIERCAEEFITRKDSGALEMFKGDTYERKPQRFEMTFRVMRRGKGEWAERTYRSYQKQPLTVALTKEITLAAHRMIGLFLRRHDQNFRWLDCPAPEMDSEGSETTVPSQHGPLSLLAIPRSRFIEATQTFEFVPGYSIELCFRSRNPQREIPTFERRIKVNSTQTTPLTLFMSEDMLWKALHFVNLGLGAKKRAFDDHLRDHRVLETPHSEDDTLEVGLRVSNNLGPVYNHVHRNLKSKLALFRDSDAKDCEDFLCDIQKHLSNTADEADSTLNAMDDLEFRMVELKGVGWTLREPAKFTLGPAASYGRRTIQAALDRIQTGVGDVIRGHNIAIHISAHKRGHLVLDKAIVAHEKRGKPKETFPTHEDAQTAFVSRLKARIQQDIDKVFEDSCSIDDIPEDEEDYFARPVTPVTPVQPEQAVFDGPSPRFSPSSVRSSPAKPRPALSSLQGGSPRPRAQRVFSLSRRSTESVRSIDYLKTARDLFAESSSTPIIAVGEQAATEPRVGASPLPQGRGPLLAAAEVKPARSFSLVSRRPSSAIRVSNASTLVEEQAVCGDGDGQYHKEAGAAQGCSVESHGPEVMTSNEEATPAAAPSRELPGGAVPGASLASHPAVQHREVSPQVEDNKDAPSVVPGPKQSKMDTPEFVDAREYASSPAAQEIAKAELSGALAGIESPRDDDEYSTAPSTPELSTGASSPRQSVLITPVYLRTNSGAKEPALRSFYPASEPEHEESDLQGERESAAATPDSKGDHDRFATDASPSGQPCLNPLPSPITTSSLAADDAPRIAPGDADSQCVSGGPDPATRVVSLAETPGTQPAPTPRPSSTTAAASPSPGSNTTDPASESPDVHTADLGAELTAASEEERRGPGPAPDFPTPEVRTTSDTNNKEEAAAAHHCSPAFDASNAPEPAVTINANAKSTLASEDPDSGRELGAEPTETVVVEDSVRGGVPDDVADGPSPSSAERCGAESEHDAVPPSSSWAAVAADAVEIGTEIELETGKEVPRGGLEPGVCDGGGGVGGEGVGAGSGVVADGEEGEQPIPEAATSQDVGPVEEAADASQSDDADVRVPENVTAEFSEESTGPGAGFEAAHVESKDVLSDTMDADHAVNELTVEPEEVSSGPVDVPERTERPVADPDQAPAPTGPGADESSSDSHVEPEDDTPDTVTADHPVIETISESEKGSSGPDPVPEQTEHPATAPELQDDGDQAPAPTVFGDEESLGPHLEDSVAAEGPKSPGRCFEDDAVGAVHQDAVPGASADAPEIGETVSSTWEDEGSGPDQGAGPLLGHDIASDGSDLPGGHVGDDAVGAVAEDTVPAVLAGAPAVGGEALQSGLEASSAAPSPRDVAEVGSPKLDDGDRTKEELDAVTVATGAAEVETPKLDAGDFERETLPVPAGPEPVETETSERAAGEGGDDTSDTLPPVVDVTGIDGQEADAAEAAEGTLPIASPSDAAETETPERDVADDGREFSTVPVVVGGASDGVEAGAATDVASVPAKGDVGDELGTPADVAKGIPAPEMGASAPETDEEQPIEANGESQGLAEDPYEFDKEEPHADAGVGNDDDASSKRLGSEIGIGKTGAFLEDDGRKLETNNDVCTEPGVPESRTPDKPAPAIVDDLTNITPSTEPLTAGTTALEGSAAAETPTPKPTTSPPPRQEKVKAKSQLAPIPDLSKLSSRSSTASFTTSPPRDSVDTIRPSTDEHRHPTLPEPPHTTTTASRPKTAGYLGIGLLRGESRFIEVGLRGALGDVKSRRLSLPLQHLLDTESDGVERPPAPASEAGGVKRSKLKKNPAVGEHSNGWDDEQAAVLPRMMMMLAGAVALGKIMKQAAGGD